MSEETTPLSPDNHEIRLKLIAIETPMDRDVAVAQYSLYSVGHSVGNNWRTLATINVEVHCYKLPCDGGVDFVRIQADAEKFLKSQFAHIGQAP